MPVLDVGVDVAAVGGAIDGKVWGAAVGGAVGAAAGGAGWMAWPEVLSVKPWYWVGYDGAAILCDGAAHGLDGAGGCGKDGGTLGPKWGVGKPGVVARLAKGGGGAVTGVGGIPW